MRGHVGTAGGPAEARHRLAGSPPADASDRKDERSNYFRDPDKSFSIMIPERSSSWKICSLKLLLTIIICGSFLILHAPTVHHGAQHPPDLISRSGLENVGWIWDRTKLDSRYVSHLDVNWANILSAIEKLDGRGRYLKIGLLNFNIAEINYWQQLLPSAKFSIIELDYAGRNVTWEALYPEWIDEEQESGVPSCPNLPEPKVPGGSQLDLVAVKLPCKKTQKNWSRNVARLHLQLAAAKVAADSAGGQNPVHVLFVTNCFPIPNLFTCKSLVIQEGNAWLYKQDSKVLRESLMLPVGSCELSVPLKAKERSNPEDLHREAYATILHSASVYACGAIAAAQSIRLAGSTRDLVILVDETISDHHRSGLEHAGWKVKTIQKIRNPKAERDAYNEWNYSKFRLWQLTEYDKVVFIDADLLVLRNIDFLFRMPEITATGNDGTLFNSGVMVIEPSNCTFQLLMDHIDEIESYNGGDQGYLNEIFTWWHRTPRRVNFLKHFWEGDEQEIREAKTRLFGADPPELHVLHYLGLKPWLCFRDYDCNWNVNTMQEFASDAAHARWWKMHDAMPEELQSYCLLSTKQKAALEWDRLQAEKANYSDGHWKRKIADPRLNVCKQESCDWEEMLLHWDDPNRHEAVNRSTS